MKKLTKFERSQRAHKRLNKLYMSRGNTDKNRALGNYHAHCIELQNMDGKVLPKQQRKKLFQYWCREEGYNFHK